MEQVYRCTIDEFSDSLHSNFAVATSHSPNELVVKQGVFQAVQIKLRENGEELVVKFRPGLTKLSTFILFIAGVILGLRNPLYSLLIIPGFFIFIAFSSKLIWKILRQTQTAVPLKIKGKSIA